MKVEITQIFNIILITNMDQFWNQIFHILMKRVIIKNI